jgi:hypothetical protein
MDGTVVVTPAEYAKMQANDKRKHTVRVVVGIFMTLLVLAGIAIALRLTVFKPRYKGGAISKGSTRVVIQVFDFPVETPHSAPKPSVVRKMASVLQRKLREFTNSKAVWAYPANMAELSWLVAHGKFSDPDRLMGSAFSGDKVCANARYAEGVTASTVVSWIARNNTLVGHSYATIPLFVVECDASMVDLTWAVGLMMAESIDKGGGLVITFDDGPYMMPAAPSANDAALACAAGDTAVI